MRNFLTRLLHGRCPQHAIVVNPDHNECIDCGVAIVPGDFAVFVDRRNPFEQMFAGTPRIDQLEQFPVRHATPVFCVVALKRKQAADAANRAAFDSLAKG